MNVCGQSCFVRSPVLGGLFGVVVPCWNIGVDSFHGLKRERAAKFLWLGAVRRRSRGQASPPAHPTSPFMFPNRRPRAAPHSYCSTNACVCLIPETWWQWPPCHEWKKSGLIRSVLCLLLIFILNFLCLSCLSFSLRPPVPILVCVSLIITFWYWRFPEVTDHRFSYHMCFFAMFFSRSLSPLFITLSFSALYVT